MAEQQTVAKADNGTLGAHSFTAKLFAFFMILPFVTAPILSIHFPKVLAYIMPACGVIGIGILFFGLKKKPDLPKGLVVYGLSVLALAGGSVLWAFYPEETFDRVTKLVPLIVFSLLFIGAVRGGKGFIPVGSLLDITLVASAVAALILSAEILNGGFIYKLTRDALEPSSYSTAVYNKGSIVITVMGVCAFMLHPLGPTLKKAVFLLPLLVMLYLIQGQAIQVALALGLVIYFLFPYKFRLAWLAAFLLIVAGFAVKPVIAPMAYDAFAQNLQNVEYMRDAYASHRLEIWDYVSREIWTSPFIGHGIEFTRAFKEFDSARVFLPVVAPIHPHSFILQIWLELGMVGVALALAGIGYLMKYIYQVENLRIKRTAFSALAVLMFIACVTFNLWQGWWLAFLLTVAALFMMVVKTSEPDTIKGKELPTSA